MSQLVSQLKEQVSNLTTELEHATEELQETDVLWLKAKQDAVVLTNSNKVLRSELRTKIERQSELADHVLRLTAEVQEFKALNSDDSGTIMELATQIERLKLGLAVGHTNLSREVNRAAKVGAVLCLTLIAYLIFY